MGDIQEIYVEGLGFRVTGLDDYHVMGDIQEIYNTLVSSRINVAATLKKKYHA